MNVHECILHVPGCVHVGQSVESTAVAAEGKWQIQELVFFFPSFFFLDWLRYRSWFCSL